MGAIVIGLSLIGILVLIAYLKFPPAYAKPKLVNTFDLMVLGVCVFLCLVWILHAYTTWAGGPADKFWLPLAMAGALGIEIVMLAVCFILRNFYVFKPKRPGAGGWF